MNKLTMEVLMKRALDNIKRNAETKMIFTIVILALVANFFALPISVDEARITAESWYHYWNTSNNSNVGISDTLIEKQNDQIVFYTFIFEPAGFVIVSADDATTPILGYSHENLYVQNPEHPAIQEMITSYKEQIMFVKDNNIDNNETRAIWDNIQSKNYVDYESSRASVSPLLQTTWNQGYPYNMYCPSTSGGSGGRVWAGCVATAMAQVMRYHNHPTKGTGSHSYYHNSYGTQSANFGATTYNWAAMSLNSGNSHNALLMRHCGVAVNMNYGPNGSGAYSSTVVPALKNYFKYDSNLRMVYKSSYSTSSWTNLLKSELEAGRPLFYRGSGSGGHAFNIDGYSSSGYFHLNWGWGGYYNGYFAINDLTPGSYNFSNYQATIIGVQPSNRPILTVDKQNIVLDSDSGIFEICISNTGTGIMNWTVSEDLTWLSITSASSGTGDATLTFSYTNSSVSYRQGEIVISVEDAANSNQTIDIHQMQFDGFSPKQKLIDDFKWPSSYSRTVGDVNGDGKDDVIGFNNNHGVYVALSNGSGFGPKQKWLADFIWNEDFKRTMADVNGDGKEDVVGFNNNHGVYVSLSTGNGFGPKQKWLADFIWHKDFKRTMADVNGDGKADVVGFNNNHGVYVALSNGSGFGPKQKWLADFIWHKDFKRTMADVNGDGKADVVGFNNNHGVYVALSNGSGFGPKQKWLADFIWHRDFKRTMADVNGDGKADVIGFNNNHGVYVALSTGSSFIPKQKWLADFTWPVSFRRDAGDINGDGKADIVGFNNNHGVYIATYSSCELSISNTQYTLQPTQGSFTFQIDNNGNGSLNWSIDTEDDWLNIMSNSSGINQETITIGYNKNIGPARTGVIIVSSDNSITPVIELNINQNESFSLDEKEIWLADFVWPADFDRTLADVNGDGKDDVVGFNNNHGVYVALSTGNGFGPKQKWLADFIWHKDFKRTMADVNGDGKADVVGFNNNHGVYVALSTGNGFSPKQKWLADFIWHKDFKRTMADVNGDGKADVVGFNNNHGVYVALSTGNGFGPKQKWLADFIWHKDFERTMADVNGDGKADVVGFNNNHGVYVALSTGNGFGSKQKWLADFIWNKDFKRTMADVNGDGKADVVGFNNNHGVYISPALDGNNFMLKCKWSSQFRWDLTKLRRTGDVNGDGKADIIGFDQHGVWVSITRSSDENVILDEVVQPHQVTASNYPNPFNPSTSIKFNIPLKSDVNVKIYNAKGQLVKTLVNEELLEGEHEVIWNGTNQHQREVSSGIYFIRIKAGTLSKIHKCMLVK
jgi:hypothetical protein